MPIPDRWLAPSPPLPVDDVEEELEARALDALLDRRTRRPLQREARWRLAASAPGGESRMSDSQARPGGSNEDDVKAREREKLDIGDSHPQDRDIAPRRSRQGEGLDVGDPHPERVDSGE